MATTDPIADLLTRIRNAQHARKDTCEIPASQLKESVLKILQQTGWVESYTRQEQAPQDVLVVRLKYKGKLRTPTINHVRRISKPGRRIYRRYQEIKPLLDGYGFAILSTSKGVLKDDDARRQKVGGEVLCEIW
ncbi:MAG: Ribosomal protein S8 [uncultured bacterium]|nr:MAG: Ribosomal protein S8 [uncultured bacterium]HLD45226.1 30S ribosomal protein S8 [bacterium]